MELSAVAQDYAVSVYTDDTIKNAKADRAKLNKFVDALNAKRTEIRKQLLKPDEQFGQEVKELTGIVQEAIENIDGQIKDYERRQREEKTEKIREFYEAHIHDIGEYLPFERVMKPGYANASTTMKSIKQEILDQIQKVDEGLAILNEVDSPYAGDMKKVFLQNYDIGAAMAERNRLETEQRNREIFLEDQRRRKEEREARERAETEKISRAGQKPQDQSIDATVSAAAEPAPQRDPVYEMRFCVHGTREQILKLRDFMKANQISFERI